VRFIRFWVSVITNVTNSAALFVVSIGPQLMEGNAQKTGDHSLSRWLGTEKRGAASAFVEPVLDAQTAERDAAFANRGLDIFGVPALGGHRYSRELITFVMNSAELR
jgi:hypothetical protein